MEALNTAQGARDFIYSLHSTERSCLLKELHRFESIAIAQGKGVAGGRSRGALGPLPYPAWPREPCRSSSWVPPPPSPSGPRAWDVRAGRGGGGGKLSAS